MYPCVVDMSDAESEAKLVAASFSETTSDVPELLDVHIEAAESELSVSSVTRVEIASQQIEDDLEQPTLRAEDIERNSPPSPTTQAASKIETITGPSEQQLVDGGVAPDPTSLQVSTWPFAWMSMLQVLQLEYASSWIYWSMTAGRMFRVRRRYVVLSVVVALVGMTYASVSIFAFSHLRFTNRAMLCPVVLDLSNALRHWPGQHMSDICWELSITLHDLQWRCTIAGFATQLHH